MTLRMMKNKRVGVALFGAGAVGKVHIRHLVLHEKAEILWVVDENLEAAQNIVAHYKLEKSAECVRPKDADHVWKDER